MNEHRLNIAVPVAFVSAANQFAALIGNAEDVHTFTEEPTHQDTDGNMYSVASGYGLPMFTEPESEPPVPEHDVDDDAANVARSMISVFDPETDVAPFATPDMIAVVAGDDVNGALVTLGLTAIPAVIEQEEIPEYVE